MARIQTNTKVFADVKVSAMVHFFSSLPNPAILTGGRYSYFAAEPAEIFEFKIGDKKPFEKLRAILNKYRIEKSATHSTSSGQAEDTEVKNSDISNDIFTGGWLGFFGYDLNQHIENIIPVPLNNCARYTRASEAGINGYQLPNAQVIMPTGIPPANDDLKLPLIRLCFYDKVICFDSVEKCFHLFAFEPNGGGKIAQLENFLKQAGDRKNNFILKPSDNFDIADFNSNMTKDYYLQSIEKVKKYIYDGDVYQINFSQRFNARFAGSAAELFLWQNKFNPSPYAAYLDCGDYQIISASPELFININAGTITTCPIKGTRPRTGDETNDAKNYAELIASEKELAELDMITDLERNDLGKICLPGSIKVKERRKIETFATVFHAVSTVEGKIKAGLDFVDCLKAVFPGGSISGAPKISAMNIINSLEPTTRGIYTGSIGWIDLRGNASLNIAIRTILVKAGIAYAQTGGGIVADSQPEAEWHETLVKAKALLAGLTAVDKKKKNKVG